MSREIWKFVVPIDDQDHEIAMPIGARLAHVATQRAALDRVTLWAEVEPQQPQLARTYRVFGTGHTIPYGYQYCGTAIAEPLVWHLYEQPSSWRLRQGGS